MQANNGPSDRGTKNSGASNSKSDSSYLGDNSHSRNLQSRVVICGDDSSLLPSSGADASAIGTGRVQWKKTLTKKGQAFYSATSTVSTTGVVQAWVGQKRLNYYILSLFCDVR